MRPGHDRKNTLSMEGGVRGCSSRVKKFNELQSVQGAKLSIESLKAVRQWVNKRATDRETDRPGDRQTGRPAAISHTIKAFFNDSHCLRIPVPQRRLGLPRLGSFLPSLRSDLYSCVICVASETNDCPTPPNLLHFFCRTRKLAQGSILISLHTPQLCGLPFRPAFLSQFFLWSFINCVSYAC